MSIKIIDPTDGCLVRVNRPILRFPSHMLTRNQDGSSTFVDIEPFTDSINVEVGEFDKFPSTHSYYEWIDRGELLYAPQFFNDKYKLIPKSLYSKIINLQINSYQDLVKYPFIDIDRNDTKERSLERFSEYKKWLKTLVKSVKNRESIDEFKRSNILPDRMVIRDVYLRRLAHDRSGVLSNLELDKSWNSRMDMYNDSEFQSWSKREVSRIVVFDGWTSYVEWELFDEIEKANIPIVCQNCGSVLSGVGHHGDRVFCTAGENLACWRERKRVKQARYRYGRS